ncbi:Hypothetical protein SSO1920 [Saccharolobus solfataricus P2]|uniref:Uncharacterized protein n=2 Tax=Saccharolobus solfataricus TaxID=2287 RepID=Q97X34_SACS2|nr:Hypothetical protein SSO1920 [Saccharolobus solfataricus P2]SAI85597.1 uncharacterised protein [Saccharolobus solfataricus]
MQRAYTFLKTKYRKTLGKAYIIVKLNLIIDNKQNRRKFLPTSIFLRVLKHIVKLVNPITSVITLKNQIIEFILNKLQNIIQVIISINPTLQILPNSIRFKSKE